MCPQPGMSLEEAKELLRKCIAELKIRFLVQQPTFTTKIIDKEGVREISLE